MAKGKKKPIVYPVIFMLAVSAIFTFVLASLNAATVGLIEEQEALKNQRSLLYLFDQPVPEERVDIQQAYENLFTTKTIKDVTYYEAVVDGEVLGYAFPFQGSGLWGSIWGYVAVDTEFNEIIGVDFLKDSETPGLGGRINEVGFKDQFRGINIDEQMETFIVYRSAEDGNADVITGATLTSNAVQNMINAELRLLFDEIKGEI